MTRFDSPDRPTVGQYPDYDSYKDALSDRYMGAAPWDDELERGDELSDEGWAEREEWRR